MPLDKKTIWKVVSTFSASSIQEEMVLAQLQKFAEQQNLSFTKIQSKSEIKVLTFSLAEFWAALEQTGGKMQLHGLDKDQVPATARVVFVATVPSSNAFEEFFSLLKSGTREEDAPDWLAILQSPTGHHPLFDQLTAQYAAQSFGMIIMPDSLEFNITFELFQNPLRHDRLQQRLETREKIAEGPDNLKRRETWFRRRTDPRPFPEQ